MLEDNLKAQWLSAVSHLWMTRPCLPADWLISEIDISTKLQSGDLSLIAKMCHLISALCVCEGVQDIIAQTAARVKRSMSYGHTLLHRLLKKERHRLQLSTLQMIPLVHRGMIHKINSSAEWKAFESADLKPADYIGQLRNSFMTSEPTH